ncbi:MAG: tetratricopeptide repeat protein [Acidobacteriota bacterium]
MLKALIPALFFICIGTSFAVAPLQQDLETSAREAIAARRFREARELYRTLSETNPQKTDYILWVGRLSGWLRDYQTAIAAFDRALARNSRDSAALIGKAYILMYQQRYRASEELLDRARQIVPENLELMLAFARSYHYQRQDDKAQKVLSQVLALEPNNSEAQALQEDITPRRFEMVTGYGQDRLSVASPAHVGAVSIGYVGSRNRATVQHEVWNKFGDAWRTALDSASLIALKGRYGFVEA